MKTLATVYKEFLLLVRDPGGMALLFLMPLALVIVMALIQDAPFRDYAEVRLDILLVNQDQDSLGRRIEEAFAASPNLRLINRADTAGAKEEVRAGKFKAVIMLPAGASDLLRKHSKYMIDQVLYNSNLSASVPEAPAAKTVNLRIFFDPVIKTNYKQALSGALEKIATGVEAEWIVDELQRQLTENKPTAKKIHPDLGGLIKIRQAAASDKRAPVELNSVQHNVPAWTMFAMFFILFPLAGNYIKEREEGSLLRVRLISGSPWPAVTGKFMFYLGVCLAQFVLMMAVGIYVMPWLGLNALVLGHNATGILLTACSVAVAATGFGTLVAVYFRTPQQALSFGSISVVILSALGGVWVPVYVMPAVLQRLSTFSPLNWGLESFNDLFLRDADTRAIVPALAKLLAFGAVTLGVSIFISKTRKAS